MGSRVSARVAMAIPAMIAGSERRWAEAGSFRPFDRCTMLIESSTVTDCTPSRLVVLLGAGHAGQDQRLAAVNQVAAVELGGDLDGEVAAAQGFERSMGCLAGRGRSCRPCRRTPSPPPGASPKMVPTTSSPGSRGGVDLAGGGDPVEQRIGRMVVDALGAIALDVAVAADRARSCARAADVAAQEQQVDDLADGSRRRAPAGRCRGTRR